jgi:TATA-binding protein-associated factor Taf7
MCEECYKIQNEISQYRRFLNQLLDPLTEARFKATIAELERDLEERSCERGKA